MAPYWPPEALGVGDPCLRQPVERSLPLLFHHPVAGERQRGLHWTMPDGTWKGSRHRHGARFKLPQSSPPNGTGMTIQVALTATAPLWFSTVWAMNYTGIFCGGSEGCPAARPVSSSTSSLGAEAVMAAQGISWAGKMPLGFLAKSRTLSGSHQLVPMSLGWERALEHPTLTILGLIVTTMSQVP